MNVQAELYRTANQAKPVEAQYLRVGMWALTTDDRGDDRWGRITDVQVRRSAGSVTYTVALDRARFGHTAPLRESVHVLTSPQARRVGLS